MVKRAAVAVAICFAAGLVYADTAQDVLEKVKKKYDSITDAEMKFTQTVTFGLSKAQQVVSGTLAIKKPDKYRVETAGRTIVTDGVTVWSYSQQTHQVLIDNYKTDERALTPEKVLAAAPQDYYASVLGTENMGKTETLMLKLVPKDANSLVGTMKIWVDESTWLIRKAEIVDVNGKQTVYTVSDIKINTGIPDSRFTYDIPGGVDTVDLR